MPQKLEIHTRQEAGLLVEQSFVPVLYFLSVRSESAHDAFYGAHILVGTQHISESVELGTLFRERQRKASQELVQRVEEFVALRVHSICMLFEINFRPQTQSVQ